MPGGQAGQVDQVGGLGDPGAVTGLDLHARFGGTGFTGLIRRGPRRLREQGEGGVDVEVGEAGPDGELHPVPVQVGGELLGGAGGVGAHQHRYPPVRVAGPQRGG